MTWGKFLWNYFTFAGTSFNLTARKKKKIELKEENSLRESILENISQKRGVLDLKGFLYPSILDPIKFINFIDSQLNS